MILCLNVFSQILTKGFFTVSCIPERSVTLFFINHISFRRVNSLIQIIPSPSKALRTMGNISWGIHGVLFLNVHFQNLILSSLAGVLRFLVLVIFWLILILLAH